MLLILFIFVPITVLSNATICSHFGYNWAAEIRCLRSQLTLCQSATESVVRGARMIDEQDSSRVSMQFVPLANFYRSPSTLLKPDSLFDRLMTNVTQYFDRGFIEMKDKLEEEQKRRISELQGGLESGQRIIENRYDRKSAEMKRNFEAEVKKITKRLNLLAARVHRFGPFEYIYIENYNVLTYL
uniref:Uncharacterized protein n=1 Tax=Heterorhabditis bacteriophora TaxID=37862 RepID=A0A1I7X8S3_HETBA